MLSITSIVNGIVIDHIKPGRGYEIFKLLDLDKKGSKVALIMNAESKNGGMKDLIKIEDVSNINLDILGIVDKDITINLIENEKIIKKFKPELPESFEGLFTCKNPRCITTSEREIHQKFDLIDKENGIYKCAYCDHLLNMEE